VNRRARVWSVVSLALGLLVAWIAIAPPRRVSGEPAHAGHRSHGPMTDAAMEKWTRDWWAAHQPVGVSAQRPAAAAFTARNFQFDTDNNLATQVDTAQINVGETVTWQWINGFHTVTNGNDSFDPQAGALFDQPVDPTSTSFSFTFNTPGTFPFFCRPHEGLMAGVVVVQSVVGVPPGTTQRLGFTRDPSPNPSTGGVSFAFSLRAPGRARAEVFDAIGRRVAVLTDADLPAGSHEGAWDGRRHDGARAMPGVYYLRLRIPGRTATRTISLGP
jgi:plastocyanin